MRQGFTLLHYCVKRCYRQDVTPKQATEYIGVLLECGCDPLRLDDRLRTAADLDAQRRLPILHPEEQALGMLGMLGDDGGGDGAEGDGATGGGTAAAAAAAGGGAVAAPTCDVAFDAALRCALLGEELEFSVTFGDGPMGLHVDQSAAGLEIVEVEGAAAAAGCLLYTSPSPRDGLLSRMPSSA